MYRLPVYTHYPEKIIRHQYHPRTPGANFCIIKADLCCNRMHLSQSPDKLQQSLQRASIHGILGHSLHICCAASSLYSRRRAGADLALKSVLTIAGAAAVWGLIVLSVHLLWDPPAGELLTWAPASGIGIAPAGLWDSANTSLLEVIHICLPTASWRLARECVQGLPL